MNAKSKITNLSNNFTNAPYDKCTIHANKSKKDNFSLDKFV